jgi:hypothetical protein
VYGFGGIYHQLDDLTVLLMYLLESDAIMQEFWLSAGVIWQLWLRKLSVLPEIQVVNHPFCR